ncbi:hypothetical protein AOG23_19290 [Rhizobium acidisoli]|nr:hypothetical protein AOG23_19290 [Rhizobium acidisoli]
MQEAGGINLFGFAASFTLSILPLEFFQLKRANFLTLFQQPQAIAHDLAGAGIAPAFDKLSDKPFIAGANIVAGGHSDTFR